MALEALSDYFKFTGKQKLDLLLTILLPLASGTVIIIAVNPSLATEAGFLNLCLLASVAILPIWLTNIIVWSILFNHLIRAVVNRAISLGDFPTPVDDRLKSLFHDFPLRIKYGIDPIRHWASIITSIAAYIAAGITYVSRPSLWLAYCILVPLSLLPALVFKLIIHSIVVRIGRDELYKWWVQLTPHMDKEARRKGIDEFRKMRDEMYQHAGQSEPGADNNPVGSPPIKNKSLRTASESPASVRENEQKPSKGNC